MSDISNIEDEEAAEPVSDEIPVKRFFVLPIDEMSAGFIARFLVQHLNPDFEWIPDIPQFLVLADDPTTPARVMTLKEMQNAWIANDTANGFVVLNAFEVPEEKRADFEYEEPEDEDFFDLMELSTEEQEEWAREVIARHEGGEG